MEINLLPWKLPCKLVETSMEPFKEVGRISHGSRSKTLNPVASPLLIDHATSQEIDLYVGDRSAIPRLVTRARPYSGVLVMPDHAFSARVLIRACGCFHSTVV